MKKELKKFLPVVVGVVVLIILIGARAWRLSVMPAGGRWPDVAGGTYATPVMKDGLNYLIPPDELYDNGMGKDGIPALNSPTYVSVATADDALADEVEGIDVEVNGKHRFYSFQILNWHEIVNDKFGDKELLISYSPLCGSAVVYDRHSSNAAENALQFGDSGKVYNNCPVFYDTTTSALWSQTTGQTIVGNDKAVGDGGTVITLSRYPSAVMTWDAWKKANPNGEALSTETGFVRDYRRHPYGNYDNNTSLFFPVNKLDTRLANKDVINDYLIGGEQRHIGTSAKFLSFVKEPNYTAGDTSYTAFVDSKNVAHLFNRLVAGQTLSFVRENNEIKDKETDSRWSAEGVCIKGKLKGKTLSTILPSARYFAFAYVSNFPTAILLGSEIFDQANAPKTEPSVEPTTLNVGE